MSVLGLLLILPLQVGGRLRLGMGAKDGTILSISYVGGELTGDGISGEDLSSIISV